MIRFYPVKRGLAGLALAAAALIATPAAADIALSPLRQVLSKDSREAVFTVSNPSKRIIDGRVSWTDLTATETGYAPADRGARSRFSAAPYLVLEPANFRLEPGARIEIKVRLKDGVAPPPGERRSHLLIETAAARTPLRKASDQGLQVDIGAGVSAPVMLRGDGRAAASIGDTHLLRDKDGLLVLSTSITPEGNQSTYGRLIALFLGVGEKDAQIIGERDNVVGYPDAEHRKVDIPLGFFTLGPGELTLRYDGAAEFAGKLFDERRFDIEPPKE